MRGGNETEEWDGNTGQAHTWGQFDALPRGVKRAYWNAPYNYTAFPSYAAWRAGADMREHVARLKQAMARDVRRESLSLYGGEQMDCGQ